MPVVALKMTRHHAADEIHLRVKEVCPRYCSFLALFLAFFCSPKDFHICDMAHGTISIIRCSHYLKGFKSFIE